MSRGTIFITGISGFVGRHLAEYYAARGFLVAGTYHLRKPHFETPLIRVYRASVLDERRIADLLAGIRPVQIFHLAAVSVPRHSWKDPAHTMAVNAGGTIHLLRGVRRLRSRPRVVFVSTNLVYGRTLRTGQPATEMSVLYPEDPYSMSKAAAEMACFNFCRDWGVDVLVARPFNHIGPGQSPALVFSDWCRQIAFAEKRRGDRLLRVGNLDACRDILHVKDVVSAYDVLARRGRAGEVYNICTQRSLELRRFIDHLLNEARVPLSLVSEKKRLRTGDPKLIRGDAGKLMALGWKPAHTVFEALTDLLEYWRHHV